jgi:hypothetical protein
MAKLGAGCRAAAPALAYLFTWSVTANGQAPAGPIAPAEAIHVLQGSLEQSHHYYNLDERCLALAEPTYANRGYTIEVRGPLSERKCPARWERCAACGSLDRWRVDAFTRAVFLQDRSGRYMAPRLMRRVGNARGALVPPGYRLNATIELDVEGTEGRLELLEDERLAPPWDMVNLIPGNGSCELVASRPEERGICESLESLRGPVFRLVDGSGREASRVEVGGVLGDVRVEHMYRGGQPTYFVTGDPACRVSLWCGPHTQLVEARNGRLAELEAEDTGTHRRELFLLTASARNHWWISLSPRGESEVLEVGCVSGTKVGDPFDSVYRRYSFESGRWVRRERREAGCGFESEFRVPPRTKFP